MVCGLACVDRVAAFLRLLERELVHVIELLVWNRSRCGVPRFASIARRFFAHTAHRHELVTRSEQLLEKLDLRIGDWVTFRKRDRRYSDGNRYAKFYVPVEAVTPLDPSQAD